MLSPKQRDPQSKILILPVRCKKCFAIEVLSTKFRNDDCTLLATGLQNRVNVIKVIFFCNFIKLQVQIYCFRIIKMLFS